MNSFSQENIRKSFIEFFNKKFHSFVKSASLIPQGDKSLIFTNSGMNQFKDIFLGFRKPLTKRVHNYQKCIRISGKHNDIEEVGYDTYHHTFFEMLGNWSFGDYYKKEAIIWAWELLTEVWKLPKNKLFATVYFKDDESFNLWSKVTDISPKNIMKFKEKDNFWEMADVGPCGPCSEIHIDLGEENCTCKQERKKACREHGGGVNQDCARYIEIWNLVFIQFNRNKEGELSPLKEVHVDTGMGFERICAVLQKKKSNYDTDIFVPLIKKVEKITSLNYQNASDKEQIAFKVIVDHIRTIAFSIADGVIPSNEGRGYVIRRVIRRAFRYGKSLGLEKPFLYKLIENLAINMGRYYSELQEKIHFIKKILLYEEELFLKTLTKGLLLFEKLTLQVKKNQENFLKGSNIFELYDTYGFPLDLIKLLAKEENLGIDELGFNQELTQQRKKSRNKNKESIDLEILNDFKVTEYLTDNKTKNQGTLLAIIKDNKKITTLNFLPLEEQESIFLIFNKTPFYGESGGQVGDSGEIYSENKDIYFKVTQTLKYQDIHLLKGTLTQGTLLVGESYWQAVNLKNKNEIKKNHTATHLLQQTLIDILGDHVKQAGSLITAEKLRFDFNHYEEIKPADITKIENAVNENILKNLKVKQEWLAYEVALKNGARAFFEEKYKDEVRVISIGKFSKELCGGSHVDNSSEIGAFKIISENGVASGTRRIEAITGNIVVEDYLKKSTYLNKIFQELKTNSLEELLPKVITLKDKNKRLSKEIDKISIKEYFKEITSKKVIIKKKSLYYKEFKEEKNEILKQIIDEIKKTDSSSIFFFINQIKENSVYFTATTPTNALLGISAKKLLAKINSHTGGHGGGKDIFAQGGSKIFKTTHSLLEIIKNEINHVGR